MRGLITGGVLVAICSSGCDVEVHLGQPDATSTGASGNLGGDSSGGGVAVGGALNGAAGGLGCELVDSAPLVIEEAGTIVENLRIVSTGEPAIHVRADDVIVRNVVIEHRGAPGVLVDESQRVTLQDLEIVHGGSPSSGPNETTETDNIHCQFSSAPVLSRIRVTRGSTGVYLQECPDARVTDLEGHDIRGPFPHGQLIRFELSPDGSLDRFSVENTADSYPENNVHVSRSARVNISRGLIDGNNAPQGHGVLFSGSEAVGTVEDVDAIRMGNGCFSTYTGGDGTIFRRTRCRENICTDQGRGLPSSGGVMWTGDESQTDLSLLDSVYFAACTAPVWPVAAFSTLELREEDFVPRAPVRLEFCWE